MDLLKHELQKKRKAVMEDFGGKSFVRRSELDQKQLQKRGKLPAKPRAPAPATYPAAAATTTSDPSNPDAPLEKPNPRSFGIGTTAIYVPPALVAKKTTAERGVDETDLARDEVVRRLRVLREPITLFGEDDTAHIERLKFELKSGVVDAADDLDMTQGQTNDFLRDMIEMRKRPKAGRDACAKGKSKSVRGVDGRVAGDGAYDEDGGRSDADKDSKRMKAKFHELCKEDKILVFFKRLLNEWKLELDDMAEQEKRTADGNMMVARLKPMCTIP